MTNAHIFPPITWDEAYDIREMWLRELQYRAESVNSAKANTTAHSYYVDWANEAADAHKRWVAIVHDFYDNCDWFREENSGESQERFLSHHSS